MKMTVKPTQIVSQHEGVFFNMSDAGPCGVGVWTQMYSQPVYLLKWKDSHQICFKAFASMTYAREWLDEYGDSYETLWKFEPDEKVE